MQGREPLLIGQDHTINLNVTEVPVTTGNMQPALYHTTTVACVTHPLTDTPEDMPEGTPHIMTAVTLP